MGHNDHVEYEEMECLSCGAIDIWEFWDDVGRARYTGRIGEMLNVDPEHNDRRCPHCGSTKGKLVEEDDYA